MRYFIQQRPWVSLLLRINKGLKVRRLADVHGGITCCSYEVICLRDGLWRLGFLRYVRILKSLYNNQPEGDASRRSGGYGRIQGRYAQARRVWGQDDQAGFGRG